MFKPASLTRVLLISSIGLFTALGVYGVRSYSIHIEPGSAAWSRLVMGATPGGAIHEHAVVSFPGLDRRSANLVRIRVDVPSSVVNIAFDRGTYHPVRTDRNGAAAAEMPQADAPGARIDLFRGEGPPVRIRALSVAQTTRPNILTLVILGFLAGLASAVLMKRKGQRLGVALGCVTAALLTFFSIPALVFLSAPHSGSLVRLMIPAVWLAVSVGLVYASRTDRRSYWKAVLLLTAIVFGWWVRWYFLPSAGSWDTEYWKAWMTRTVSHGVSRVYGDPDAVPDGHFMAQLRGEESAWRLRHNQREFGVDYPPLAMALWRCSWSVVTVVAPHLSYGEAQNVAAKLPAVLGDIGAVLLLLLGCRRQSYRYAFLAALYWVAPWSWLSSSVLGFQDGAYVPLALVAVVAAGRGKAVLAGSFLALASLVKPLAIVVSPVVAAALVANRTSLRYWIQALGAGLGVTMLVTAPYIFDSTLAPMLVHVYRAFVPGNLSSGCANPWWLIGYVFSVIRGEIVGFTAPIQFVRIEDFPFPAARTGTIAVATIAGFIIWRQRRVPGQVPAALAAACLFFSFTMLAAGVYENHPHLFFLMLFATGLVSPRLRIFAGIGSVVYFLNLIVLSGVGRFYGTRYMILEPWVHWLSGLRTAPGFDVTLILAVVNSLLFVWLLAAFTQEIECLAPSQTSPTESNSVLPTLTSS